MPNPRPIPRALRDAPFTAAEAELFGVSRRRLRAADLDHPHHGVYTLASDADLVARCEALLPLIAPSTWFSHATAAHLWGMPMPWRPTDADPLHVMTLAGSQPIRRPGVIGWETRRTSVAGRVVGLLPLIDPAEVWCQLAVPGSLGADPARHRRAALDEMWLVAVGDFLVTGPRGGAERVPLCSLDDLEAARRRHGRRRGARALREAIARVRRGADSPGETFTRLGLVDHGLPEPEVQVPVLTTAGVLHADLGYATARIALEFQGDEHRSSRRRWLGDLTRVQLMQDAGWHVILLGAADVRPSCAGLAARVRRALAR